MSNQVWGKKYLGFKCNHGALKLGGGVVVEYLNHMWISMKNNNGVVQMALVRW